MSGDGAGPAADDANGLPSFSLEDLSLLLSGTLKKPPKRKTRAPASLGGGGGGGGDNKGTTGGANGWGRVRVAVGANGGFTRRGGVKGKGKGLTLPSLTGGDVRSRSGSNSNNRVQRFGKLVEIESRSGPVTGLYYAPPRNTIVRGLVVCAPGSGGGLGPGR